MERAMIRNILLTIPGLLVLATGPACMAHAGSSGSAMRASSSGSVQDAPERASESPPSDPVEAPRHSVVDDAGAVEDAKPDLDRAFATREVEPVYDWLEGLSGPAAESAEAWRVRIARVRLSRQVSRQSLRQSLRQSSGASSGPSDSKDRAAAMLDEALQAHPDSVELLLARASLGLETIDEAGSFGKLRIARAVRDDLERALEIDPTHVRALVANIRFHDEAPRIAGGRDRVADDLLEQLDTVDPAASAFVRFERLRSDDQPVEARARLEQAVEQAKTPKPAWEKTLAAVLFSDGEHARALQLAQSVVDRYPAYAPAWFELGRIAIESGADPNRAANALERFLELPRWPGDPEPEEARQLLERAGTERD